MNTNNSLKSQWWIVIAGCALGFAACTSQPASAPSSSGTQPSTMQNGSPRQFVDLKSAEKILADSSFAGLPKWKTSQERATERLLAGKRGKGVGGSQAMALDQYDDYRTANASRFFITTPPTTGVRVTAEYEPSQAYLLQWQSGYGQAMDAMYIEIIKGAWGVVPLILVYNDAAHKTSLQNKLTAAGLDPSDATKVSFYENRVNSIWVRDSGPVAVISATGAPKVAFVDFRYYHERIRDDELPTELATSWGINAFRPDLDFEGGNFMSTSDGLCMASRGVLWANPQHGESAVVQMFKQYMGCKKVVFLTPLYGEGTTHIDMFAKFATDTKILLGEYTNAQDSTNRAILEANAAILAKTTNGAGQPLEIIRIPMPNNTTAQGKIWRTYTNSVSLVSPDGSKKAILIPVYPDEPSNEVAAMAAYSKAYVGWTQVKINSTDIIPAGGATHCISMQIPVAQRAQIQAAPTAQCGPTALECVSSACLAVTNIGCCDGTMVKYCNNGRLEAVDCLVGNACGWEPTNGFYDCIQTPTPTSDPKGIYPRSCNAVTDGSVPDLSATSDAGVDATTTKPDLTSLPPVDQSVRTADVGPMPSIPDLGMQSDTATPTAHQDAGVTSNGDANRTDAVTATGGCQISSNNLQASASTLGLVQLLFVAWCVQLTRNARARRRRT